MFRLPTLLLSAMLSLCGPTLGLLRGEDPFTAADEVTNAALVYWQAFALLPELSEEDTELLKRVAEGDQALADATPLLGRSNLARSVARNVRPHTPCQWELIDDGPNTLLPHLSKARLLARLMVLQARADAASGKTGAAVDHLTEALLVARNVDEGVLVQMLVGDSIESLVLDTARPLLAKLDAPSVDRFAAALSKLPPRTSFAQAVSYERDVFAEWLRPIMTADSEQARATLKQIGVGDDSPDMAAILAGSAQERRQRFEEFLAEYGKTIEASKLPLPKAEAEFQRIDAAIEKSPNPLIRLLMPAFGRANRKHAESDQRFAKFETAARAAASNRSP